MSPPPPPPPGDSKNPVIDRAALDRIIQRATELQTGEREIGDSLTPDEVLALGKEVGIPGKYLQQAMLEQQSAGTPSADVGLIGRLVGPSEVRAQRVVRGDPEEVIRGLLTWMDRNELLVVQRQQAGWASWEPLKGMQAAIRRGTAALDTSKPKFMLSRAEVVTAIATPLESGLTHVAMTASLGGARRETLVGSAVSFSLGAVTTAALATFGLLGFVAAVPIGMTALIGVAVLRKYRPISDRVRLGLERALDYLEQGGIKPGHSEVGRGPGLIELLAGEVRRALTSGAEGRPPSRDKSR